jgi:hypothetical protein
MNAIFKLPPFGKFLAALNAAGVVTRTARGFWGGVTTEGEIIVTSWTDANDGTGRFYIWRPNTNHGELKTAWEVGNIRVGPRADAALSKLLTRRLSVIGTSSAPGSTPIARIGARALVSKRTGQNGSNATSRPNCSASQACA